MLQSLPIVDTYKLPFYRGMYIMGLRLPITVRHQGCPYTLIAYRVLDCLLKLTAHLSMVRLASYSESHWPHPRVILPSTCTAHCGMVVCGVTPHTTIPASMYGFASARCCFTRFTTSVEPKPCSTKYFLELLV